jgi:hypothetical protein
LLKSSNFLSPDERIDFSIVRIQQGSFLSAVVFNNSETSKAHDSLPLELFSPKTLPYLVFPSNHVVGEVVIAPWCLLVSALTLSDISTQKRLESLEIGFWSYSFMQSQWNQWRVIQPNHLGSIFF